jgi:2-polyprenyl-6-hydroxyphenyl methylase/3-demethylubiquinone-9 3-methyltransferase
MWKRIKKAYCSTPEPLKRMILWLAFARLWGPTAVRDLLKGQPGRTWHNYGKGQGGAGRGMSPRRDVVDWVGGYPFEVAKPEQIFYFYRSKGFLLERLKTCAGGHGCNEFVFRRELE